MKITSASALLLVAVVGAGCSQSPAPAPAPNAATGAATAAASAPIRLEHHSGPVSPEYQYQETITVTGKELAVARTGGKSVRTGSWTAQLTQAEADELAKAAAGIDAKAKDAVAPMGPVGGGTSTLKVGERTFIQGIVPDGKEGGYSSMAAGAKTLEAALLRIVDQHGYGHQLPAAK